MKNLIIEKLKADYKCHSIILYGSRARGDFSAESDWDFFGLGEEKISHDSFQLNGEWVDISIDNNPQTSDVLRLKDGIVIYDETGKGTLLLEKVQETLKKGPGLNEVQIRHNRNWTKKMLQRIQRGDVEANFRRHWLLFQLLEDYFMYRDLWYFGSKESLRYLEKHDQKTFKLFDIALRENATLRQVEELALEVAGVRPEGSESVKTSTLHWSFGSFDIPATIYHQENPQGLLIVFPGGGYSSLGPVLYYPINLYLDKKYDVLSLEYDFRKFSHEGDRDLFLKDLGLFLFQKVKSECAHDEIHLIAKSIGTTIVAESYPLIDMSLKEKIQKVILLTPAWNRGNVLEKMLSMGNKSFHVIGSADKLYDKKVEARLSYKGICYLTIPNADHGLDIEGDVDQSLVELRNLVDRIKKFVQLE